MPSLFWRLFFGLWLGSGFLLVGSGWLIREVTQRELPVEVRRHVEGFVADIGAGLADLHARGDLATVDARLASMREGDRMPALLLSSDGRVLAGGEVPEWARQRLSEHGDARYGLSARNEPDDTRIALLAVRASNGTPYEFIARMHDPRLTGFSSLWPWGLRLLGSIVLAGLLSAWAVRRMMSPLRVLSAAARRVAEGDLTTRVTPQLGRDHAAYARLAADFDDMTARLETLIGSQQRLMRDVSHELRSPLARIRVALELARLSQPDSTALHQIERDADRMDALIGEILVLARLESRERRLPQEPVALGLLIDEIALDARLEAEPRHVGIDTQGTTEGSLIVTGDRELLRRAIENLVRNALRHSPAGASVGIATDGDESRVRVIVSDQGPGLPEDIQRHLFEPFRRGSGEHGEGSGLGLAIAQRAIVLHGGKLEVSSSTAGTRVTIDLPRGAAITDQA